MMYLSTFTLRDRWVLFVLPLLWTLSVLLVFPHETAADKTILIVVGWVFTTVFLLEPSAPEKSEGLGLHAVGLGTPLILFWVLNHSALDSWWLRDDPCLLRSTITHGIGAHFIDRGVWQSLSGDLLMPWINLSLAADWKVFGLYPEGFYAHQLVSFSLVLVAAYGLMGVFLSPLTRGLVLSIFAASPAAFAVGQQLATRHYVEGLLMTVLCVWCYRSSLVSSYPVRAAFLACIFYSLAVTAKEVFVPLPGVLLLLPVGTFRRRLGTAVPLVLIGVLYGLWRVGMLGWANSLRGYQDPAWGPRIEGLLSWPATLGFTQDWQLGIAAALLCGAWMVLWRRYPRTIPFLIGVVAAMTLPLLSIIADLRPRHALVPILVLLGFGGFALQRRVADRGQGRWRWLLRSFAPLLIPFTFSLLSQAPVWRSQARIVQAYRGEGSFILESAAEGVLITRLADVFYLTCLTDIRRLTFLDTGGPGFCGDRCVRSSFFPDSPLWEFVDGAVRPAEPIDETHCNDADRPLSATMLYKGEETRIHWQFGPYETGSYEILLVADARRPQISFPLPMDRTGSVPWFLSRPVRWVLKYRSPEGWQTYSPLLTLNPPASPAAGNSEVAWKRL